MKSKIYGILMLAGIFCSDYARAMNGTDEPSVAPISDQATIGQLCGNIPDSEIVRFNTKRYIGLKKSDNGLIYIKANEDEELLNNASKWAYRTFAVAIDKSCPNVVDYCLQIGCDPNNADYYPKARLFPGNPKLITFLSQAVDMAMSCEPEVYEHAIEIVSILLRNGVSINKKFPFYDFEKCTFLNFVLNHEDKFGRRLKFMEFLLENDADPNVSDEKFGTSSLGVAVKLNDEEAVGFLLEKNANPDILIPAENVLFRESKDKPLVLAVKNHNFKMIEYLLNSVDNIPQKIHEDSLLIYAIKLDKQDMIDFLLGLGAIPNKKHQGMCSPIQYAIKSNHIDSAIKLFQNGARRVDFDDDNSLSTLKYAILHGREEILRKLFTEAGVDPNAPDVDGELPILSAVNIDPSMISVLIRSGANINKTFIYSDREMTILDFVKYIIPTVEEEEEEEEEEFDDDYWPENPADLPPDFYEMPGAVSFVSDSDDLSELRNLSKQTIADMSILWPRERIMRLLTEYGAKTLETLNAEALERVENLRGNMSNPSQKFL